MRKVTVTILVKWESIIPSDIRTNLTGEHLGPVVLSTVTDLIILLVLPVLAGGKRNSFSKVKSSLIFSTLGWVLYFDIIASTLSLSHFVNEGYLNVGGLLSEEIFAMSI